MKNTIIIFLLLCSIKGFSQVPITRSLPNVNNTADSLKPVSKAQATINTFLQSNITVNTSNISTNTGNISTNTSNITANSTAISTNTSNISTNTAAISTKLTLIISATFSTIPVQSGANYRLILVLTDETNNNNPTLYLYDGVGLQSLITQKIY